MSAQRVDLLIGQSAHQVLSDTRFLAAWQSLQDRCPYATYFQSPAFVRPWYQVYEAAYQPVMVRFTSADDELTGLWLLAFDAVEQELVHAGANQAEYHVWLALPGLDIEFLERAWAELQRQLPFDVLRFKYLPSASLAVAIQTVPSIKAGIRMRAVGKPLLKLNADPISASFAKKSNKSRFNRLRKLGSLDFKRVTERSQLEEIFDNFITYYDFRQGAINRTTPFSDDPLKRKFHVALFEAAPETIHLTATYLNGRVIAAVWGFTSGKTVHLGMLAYSPFLGIHSPGKLHLMQLSKCLLNEGVEVLDLTPGGDSWKERFASTTHDVADVLVYRSNSVRRIADTTARIMAWSKNCAAKAGVQPADMRRVLAALKHVRPAKLLRRSRDWIGTRRELRIYRLDRESARDFQYDPRVAENSLADLLCFKPAESWQTKEAFLSSALARLEHGQSVFSIAVEGRLASYGWMVKNEIQSVATEVQQSIALAEGGATMYDFYTDPAFRGRGLYRATLTHVLLAAFEDKQVNRFHASVLADNRPPRHVVESSGFQYIGSLYWQSRLGMVSKWADPVFTTNRV